MNAAELGAKQPSEAYYATFDFTAWLADGETITAATVSAADLADDADATATVTDVTQQSVSTPYVYVWVRAGTDQHNYAISCTVTTSAGATYELDAVLPVSTSPGAPAIEPVSLIEAKLHLRLATTPALAEAYTADDSALEGWIQTAREQVEAYTWRKLITQDCSIYFQAWPDGDVLSLPYPPLQSVTGVYYYQYGESIATEFTDFWVDTDSEPGGVVLADGYTWPTASLRNRMPIRVDYVAGYGIAADVPAVFRSAMKLMLTDLYEHRGEVVLGVPATRIPDAVRNLLDAGGRAWRF